MKNSSLIKFFVFAAIVGLCSSSAVLADDAAMLTKINDLSKQMAKMQSTIDWQSQKIRDLEKGKMVTLAEPAGDFKNNLGAAIGPAEKWLKDLDFKSDLRLRYEAQDITDNGATNDRNRFRYRLRFGFDKKLSDQMKAGFRLASGDRVSSAAGTASTGQRTSTNQTLDNNFDHKAVSIDKVYATYTPDWAKVDVSDSLRVKGIEFTAGKFANPFNEGSSWMVWDRDVNPEGLYERIEMDLFNSDSLQTGGFATFGQLILEEGAGSENDDAELYAYQWGLRHEIKYSDDAEPLKLKNIMSYYDYKDFTEPGNFAATGGNFLGGAAAAPIPGTQLAARDFDMLEIYNELGFQLGGLPSMKLFFDWVHNLDESATVSTGADENKAWLIGTKLGTAKKKGSWEFQYNYASIEANALPGVFSDGDFGRANTRGSIFRAKYAMTNYSTVGLNAFFTNSVTGGSLTTDEERRLFQTEMIWKF